MANLKIIRDRIKSVKSIQKVTKAMKMVAAAKMKKSQERMEQARPYSKNLLEMIGHLLSDVDSSSFPLLLLSGLQLLKLPMLPHANEHTPARSTLAKIDRFNEPRKNSTNGHAFVPCFLDLR